MKGDQITAFSERHGLRRVSVADIIAYRQARESLVERLGTFPVRTAHGEMTGHAYATPFDSVQHFALVHGRVGDGRDMLVRFHRADVVADVFGGGRAVDRALERIAAEKRGVLVYLRDGTAGVPTTAYPGAETTGSEAARSRAWREVGLGAQILRDLGVTSIRNLSGSGRSYVGLAGFGVELLGEEPLEA
jgi:3,4-dihydroxy 2-butanone 4-phosphate synthase/GTP cyclohydrolase II